jgi:hypothetical protein
MKNKGIAIAGTQEVIKTQWFRLLRLRRSTKMENKGIAMAGKQEIIKPQ